jgi:nucleotide-binding universal stress UspA family protein
MSILCAVDFSEPSALALLYAGELADRYAQPLTVVTVADPLLAAAEQVQTGHDPVTLLAQTLTSFVDEKLGAGSVSRHGLHVPVGDPAEEIVRLANREHSQLIVVATQGGSGMEKFVFGSVAERLMRKTDRPVLAVPPAFGGSSRHLIGNLRAVLVPVEFHDHALDDARAAVRVARASHADVRLLHVVPGDDAGKWSLVRPFAASQLAERWSGARASQADKAREALQRLADALETAHAPSLHIARGNASAEIARAAADDHVDLVVMGLHGVPGVLGTRVGAVAYRVLCASPVPVLALPHATRERDVLPFLG